MPVGNGNGGRKGGFPPLVEMEVVGIPLTFRLQKRPNFQGEWWLIITKKKALGLGGSL